MPGAGLLGGLLNQVAALLNQSLAILPAASRPGSRTPPLRSPDRRGGPAVGRGSGGRKQPDPDALVLGLRVDLGDHEPGRVTGDGDL